MHNMIFFLCDGHYLLLLGTTHLLLSCPILPSQFFLNFSTVVYLCFMLMNHVHKISCFQININIVFFTVALLVPAL